MKRNGFSWYLLSFIFSLLGSLMEDLFEEVEGDFLELYNSRKNSGVTELALSILLIREIASLLFSLISLRPLTLLVTIPQVIVNGLSFFFSRETTPQKNNIPSLFLRVSPPDCHAMFIDKVHRLQKQGIIYPLSNLVALWEFKGIIFRAALHNFQRANE